MVSFINAHIRLHNAERVSGSYHLDMKHGLVRMLICVLLAVTIHALEIEPGFPTECGLPAIPREVKEEAEHMKVRATPQSWPWHVGLWSTKYGQVPYCGGTLINRSLILTAAHCLIDLFGCNPQPAEGFIEMTAVTTEKLFVLVGTHDYVREDVSQKLRLVRYARFHPLYDVNTIASPFDIVLLKLQEDIPPHAHVQPICFPASIVSLQRGSICYYAGWGGIYTKWSKEKIVYPKLLREAQVQLEYSRFCAAQFGRTLQASESCLKTTGTHPGHGDSGGGIFCPSEDDERWFLYGTLKSGARDQTAGYAKFTNIMAIRQWLGQIATSGEL